jgi:hypothetical protein
LEYHIPVKHSAQRSIPTLLANSLVLLTLLSALTPWAAAQRQARPAIPHFKQPSANFTFRQNAHGFYRSHASRPFPFLTDVFTPDDLDSTGYPLASQPPIILLQAASALGSSDYLTRPKNNYEPATKTQPLMIELQNGRYVRITSTATNGEPLPIEPTHTQLNNAKSAITAESRPHTLPPALLVFRDGHTEEVRDYAIADGTLYARGNYYTDGYWQKKIALSTLNVPQTLEANAKHSIKFMLPTSPNEVITRP